MKDKLKKLFYKLNPNYRNIIRMNERLDRIEGMIFRLEQQKANATINSVEGQALEKLFLASEPIIYRYLYLLRYIQENDSVLDLECGYGTGADLLVKYTPVDCCLCINSIDYYTRLGQMYYGCDSIAYQTGCYADVEQKFNLIIWFHEQRGRLLKKEDIMLLCSLLEYAGILALSFDESDEMAEELIQHAQEYELTLEQNFYQHDSSPELTDVKIGHACRVIYLRKSTGKT